MQFGFMAGCGTTDVFFILSELKGKYVANKMDIYFTFEDFLKKS